MLASAELFDLASGTFSPAGSMAIARVAHRDPVAGRPSLIAAGTPAATRKRHGYLATAEAYQP